MGRGRAWPAFVIVGWGVSLAGLALTAITHAVLVPNAAYIFPSLTEFSIILLFYAGVFGLSVLSGLLLRSLPIALLGFFCSYAIGLVITGFALELPGLTGLLPQSLADTSTIIFAFTSFFPFTFFVGLVGGVLGAAATEV